jgi:hypothetical protein
MKWTKGPKESGEYYLDGTDYWVAKSADDRWWDDEGGYGPGHWEGGGIEWVLIKGSPGTTHGENLDFFDTMREAKRDAEQRAEYDQQRHPG